MRTQDILSSDYFVQESQKRNSPRVSRGQRVKMDREDTRQKCNMHIISMLKIHIYIMQFAGSQEKVLVLGHHSVSVYNAPQMKYFNMGMDRSSCFN